MGFEEICLGPFCADSCPRVAVIGSMRQQTVLNAVADIIESASRIVTIASFIFTLTKSSPAAARIRAGIVRAARRGLDVLVLLDGGREMSKEYNCGTARVLGRRGVDIWLTRGAILHMKVYAADSAAIVGSANVSSQESLELAVMIESEDVASTIHRSIRMLRDKYGATWESVCREGDGAKPRTRSVEEVEAI
jgi:phosphatidylserine/phosphatidylglycerophosphate/cardiolipin synthase-like enzyme